MSKGKEAVLPVAVLSVLALVNTATAQKRDRVSLIDYGVALYGSCIEMDPWPLEDDSLSWFASGFIFGQTENWVYVLTCPSALGLDVIEQSDHDFLNMEQLEIQNYRICVAIAGGYAEASGFILDQQLGVAVLKFRNYGYTSEFSIVPFDGIPEYESQDIVVAVGKPLTLPMSLISAQISTSPGAGSHPESNWVDDYIVIDQRISAGMEGGPLFVARGDTAFECIGVLDVPRQADENFGYAREIPVGNLTADDQFVNADALGIAAMIETLYGTKVKAISGD